MDRGATATPARLRTPRAAAVAGIVFSLLLGTTLVLIRVSVPPDPAEAGAWLTDPSRRAAVALALNLVPFAGIAFLWFIGVVRDRVGQQEDRFFATVFLGSGLLFIGMLFVAAAVGGGLLSDPAIEEGGRVPSLEVWGLGRRMTFTILNVYALRMGAVFVISAATIGLRTQTIPRWLGVTGYVVGVALLAGVSITLWVNLLLPACILVLSVSLLLSSLRAAPRTDGRPDGQRADGQVT
jgi:hypothetical protein